MTDETPFWQSKTMAEMTDGEWESLCDRCGNCCLHKLEDVDTGAIAMTDVACAYLDLGHCTCKDYANRQTNVTDCVQISPANVGNLPWLPATCAYRLVGSGQDLAWWHPLISGRPETVHEAGISARGRAISEDQVDDLEDHVTEWLETSMKLGLAPFGKAHWRKPKR